MKETARLEALARVNFSDLLPGEVKLVRAVTDLEGVNFGPENPWRSATENADTGVKRWGPERDVRAKVIRWLCTDREGRMLVDPRGIRVYGARITGELNLNYVEIPFPLHLKRCRLTGAAHLIGCSVTELDFGGSWTGPIQADRASVKFSVFMDFGFRAEGPVSLTAAQIGADLGCMAGTTVINKGGAPFNGDNLHIRGSAFFRSYANPDDIERDARPFHAEGKVRLRGARVEGDVDCAGGEFSNSGRTAFNLEGEHRRSGQAGAREGNRIQNRR